MQLKKLSALIVIDQQKGISYPTLGKRNNEDAEQEMLALMREWRRIGWPIFHIKHRSTDPQSVFWPEQEGFEFKPEFLPAPNEVMIEKRTPCAFSGTPLEILLNEAGVYSIVVVGASTNNSVEATVRSASCKGFSVLVIENACFAFEKADYFGVIRTASEVHAMSLANLQKEYALVIDSLELFLH